MLLFFQLFGIGDVSVFPQDSVGNILSMLYNGTEYYYLLNIQGDIIGILDFLQSRKAT